MCANAQEEQRNEKNFATEPQHDRRHRGGMTEDQDGFELEDLWGGEVLGGLDPLAIAAGLRTTVAQPGPLAHATLVAVGELARIATGRSTVQPGPRDARFANAAWSENPLYRRLAQTYLTWAEAMTS